MVVIKWEDDTRGNRGEGTLGFLVSDWHFGTEFRDFGNGSGIENGV